MSDSESDVKTYHTSRCSSGRCRPYEWRPVHSALSGLSSDHDVRYMPVDDRRNYY